MSASLHRGHMDTSSIELPSRRTRRRHAPEFRAQVVQACRQPGVSIAGVALANGLNANMVRKWVIEAEARAGTVASPSSAVPASDNASPASVGQKAFLSLPLPAPCAQAQAPAQDIRIELQRGTMAVQVAWPVAAATDCAAWLRELLR